jgi:hypothetical protein
MTRFVTDRRQVWAAHHKLAANVPPTRCPPPPPIGVNCSHLALDPPMQKTQLKTAS